MHRRYIETMTTAMPTPRQPKPTPAELELLRTLWQLGPSTVKQVHETQQRERPELAYANVLRLMQIMHGKGLLKRDERQRSHVYSPDGFPASLALPAGWRLMAKVGVPSVTPDESRTAMSTVRRT